MSISALDDEVFCCARFGGFSGAFLGVEHFSEEYVALVARLLAILKRIWCTATFKHRILKVILKDRLSCQLKQGTWQARSRLEAGVRGWSSVGLRC